MASSNSGEPSTAPQSNRWYDLRLGSSCRDPSSTAKYCTLRYEFKPASIDKTQAGSLQKTKDNRVTVEFHNNLPGKPKVTFEGSHEEYKDNDGILFFDGETFRLERLHRAVKRLRHVRVPGESAAGPAAAGTTGMGESHSPPLTKVGKSQTMIKTAAAHSIPVEVERIDIGEPENPVPRNNNRGSYQPVATNPFSLSPDPNDQENLDILGDDDDDGSPNNMASAQTSVRGFDINLPNQLDMEDEIADVDVNDEADEGPTAAEALRAQANAEGQQEEQETSSSSTSSSSSSSGSGSRSGSSSSDSDGSDGDSASSGGDVDI